MVAGTVGAMTTTPLAFVDTETTSLRPDREIWEGAIILRRPGRPDEEYHWFVRNVGLVRADVGALRIGGFYERHPQWNNELGSARRLDLIEASAAAEMVERVTRGAVLVARNPTFDAEGFDRLLRRHGLLPAWHYHLCDVTQMAVGWLHRSLRTVAEAGYEPTQTELGQLLRPPWRTDDLAEASGAPPQPPESKHTALGDARAVRDWFDVLTATA